MRSNPTLWCVVIAASLFLVGCRTTGGYNLPPAERLMHPGPGVTGPGPGVHIPPMPQLPVATGNATVQVVFVNPEGMQIRWDISSMGRYDSTPLIVPGRHNFPQGGIYRLKLTNITARDGVELYPTLEIGPTTPRSVAFLSHNAIPVQFTEEDFDQVLTGNFVTKVIYLPDPEFQELALAGVETLVSTRLDPGIDPIVEADRRGAIMAIVRLGNKDEEMPGADGVVEGASVGYFAPNGAPVAGGGVAMPGSPTPLSPSFVAGHTIPNFGMPITGTPIGLPGPPHIPLGIPAGLQKHTMVNHTHQHLPGPTQQLRYDIKQQPGFSYPMPAGHVKIFEQNIAPSPHVHQPQSNQFQFLR